MRDIQVIASKRWRLKVRIFKKSLLEDLIELHKIQPKKAHKKAANSALNPKTTTVPSNPKSTNEKAPNAPSTNSIPIYSIIKSKKNKSLKK